MRKLSYYEEQFRRARETHVDAPADPEVPPPAESIGEPAEAPPPPSADEPNVSEPAEAEDEEIVADEGVSKETKAERKARRRRERGQGA